MKWHPQTEQYRQECSDMTDVDKVVYLLDMFSIRQKEGQLAVLLHNAARMLEDKMNYDEVLTNLMKIVADLADNQAQLIQEVKRIQMDLNRLELQVQRLDMGIKKTF